jgi:histone-lysine N-methyltransferase SETMAR
MKPAEIHRELCDVYGEHATLKKLLLTIRNKRHGMLSRGVVMIHDYVRPHTAASTQNLITTFGWEQFDHHLYSPDLAPSDFYLFLHLNSFLGGRRFHDDNEVKEAVTTWCASQVAAFYDEGIQKLVQQYDKCLNNDGNYVEKQRRVCTSNGNIHGL